MPLLILLFLPIAEIMLALAVAERVGYLNTTALLVGAAFIGIGILSITGRGFMTDLQLRAARGEALENVLLSQALRFMAGLLFLLPGFLSDILALAFLIMSLVPSLFAKSLNNKVQRWNSQFVVFTSQSGPASGPGPWRDVTPEDPRVIDVSPEKPQSQD